MFRSEDVISESGTGDFETVRFDSIVVASA
jgi:hypothetical protein